MGLGFLTKSVGSYFSGRSNDWWTGGNSLWGKATGQPSTSPSDDKGINPLLIGVAVYFIFFN